MSPNIEDLDKSEELENGRKVRLARNIRIAVFVVGIIVLLAICFLSGVNN
jgi:hypothetical protein